MQIIHLGFHKTGTTGLQRRVFSKCGLPYYGIGSPHNKDRLEMLSFISGATVPHLEHLRSQPCILSDESGLLRFGGSEGLSSIAKSIAAGFSKPVLLLTTRDPVSLLRSAYCQSTGVRQRAIGFHNTTDPIFGGDTKELSFADWWSLLRTHENKSLCGLIRYGKTVEALSRELNVVTLPLEWVVDQKRYLETLESLGLQGDAFIASPPVNVGPHLASDLTGFDETAPDMTAYFRGASVCETELQH